AAGGGRPGGGAGRTQGPAGGGTGRGPAPGRPGRPGRPGTVAPAAARPPGHLLDRDTRPAARGPGRDRPPPRRTRRRRGRPRLGALVRIMPGSRAPAPRLAALSSVVRAPPALPPSSALRASPSA